MKMHGKEVIGNEPEIIVIPKGTTEHVFKAAPVLDEAGFFALCPAPVPPTITKPGGVTSKDITDKKYVAEVDEWAARKIAWMTLTSLKATEGLEWETVKMDDPSTWNNYQKELESCFTQIEVNLILNLVYSACGLNQRKIDEATHRFLAGLEAGRGK